MKNKYGERFEKVYQLAKSLKEENNSVLIAKSDKAKSQNASKNAEKLSF